MSGIFFIIYIIMAIILHYWGSSLLEAPNTACVKVTKKAKINGICYAVFEFPDGVEKVFVVHSRFKVMQENEMIMVTYSESKNARSHKKRALLSFEKDTALDA